MTLQSQIVKIFFQFFSPISCSFSILTRRAQRWQRSSTVGYVRFEELFTTADLACFLDWSSPSQGKISFTFSSLTLDFYVRHLIRYVLFYDCCGTVVLSRPIKEKRNSRTIWNQSGLALVSLGSVISYINTKMLQALFSHVVRVVVRLVNIPQKVNSPIWSEKLIS